MISLYEITYTAEICKPSGVLHNWKLDWIGIKVWMFERPKIWNCSTVFLSLSYEKLHLWNKYYPNLSNSPCV